MTQTELSNFIFSNVLQAYRERADILQRAFVTRLVGFAAGQGQLQGGHGMSRLCRFAS